MYFAVAVPVKRKRGGGDGGISPRGSVVRPAQE